MTLRSLQPINVIRSISIDSVGNDLLELELFSLTIVNYFLLLVLVLPGQFFVPFFLGGKDQVSLRSWLRIIADPNMFYI